MQFRFSQGGFKNYRLSKIHGFTLVELLVIIAILAILTVVGFLLLGNTTTTARDSQRIANIRQLHDATRLQVASLHTLPMPYQAIPISIGGGSGTIDLTISGATSQYAVFVDRSTQLSTLTGSKLLALTRDGGVDTLLAGGTLSGAVSNQNLGWQGYADASIAGNLNYSDTVDPQDQALFTYRLGQNRDRSQFLAYLENPENENSTPLLWNIADPVNAATSDYTKRYPYVWGDRLGIVLDKGSNAPVQQGLTPLVNNNTGSTGSGNTIDTSGMMVGVGQGHSCVLKADQSVLCWGDNDDGQTDVPSGLVDVVQISVGGYRSCALQSDGVIACWGLNEIIEGPSGMIDGILNFSTNGGNIEDAGYGWQSSVAISGPSDVTQISAGGYHTCALKSNGTVECTGADWAGQSTPPDGLVNITQISAGGYHTCALKSNGTVECWGDDSEGQTTLPLGLVGVIQISAGDTHTCALKSDGTVICWGISIEGGNPAAYVPPGLANVTQISAGSSYNCALKSDGTVTCWGEYTICPNGCYSVPDTDYVPSGLNNVVQISAGVLYTCALKSNGSVVCWDLGGVLEVPEELQNLPVILNSVVFDDHRVTTGNNFTCAITSTGGVECWGANDVGQLDIPVGLDNVLEINAGYGFACALKSDGTVECWGDPSGGETDVPVGLNNVVQMSVGYNNVCALKSDGTVVCWGDNGDGQTNVPSELNHVVQIATGWNFACALKNTGRIQCWGYNTAPGGGEISSGPLFPPSDIGTVKQISAGDEHMCAVKTDDSLACWGSNSDLSGASDVAHVSAGEYYSCLVHTDGSVECGGGGGQTDVPMTLSGVTEISTSMGGSHTCALKSDSTIVCWGREVEGQTEVPPAFGGVVFGPIVGPVFEDHTLAAGTNFTCALKSDGTVACWGINTDGQTTVPSGLTDVAQISAGDSHTCALKSDGTVACWGYNDDGETTLPSGLTDVTQISAGLFHTCSLKSDGTVECWGHNGNDQTTVPLGLVDVVQVISGGYHTCALKADKTVVCWGSEGGPQSDVPGGLTKVIQLTADADNTCALRENGRVTCWGSMSGDQSLNNVVKVHMGGGTLCVLKSDATVECLGNGIYGQLIVPNISSTVDISVGFSHVCAKNTANEITCWGSNWEGEGDAPSPFGSGFIPENITQISSDEEHLAAGQSHTCAIRSDATVECWGANYQGQSSVPSGLTDVIQVSAGLSHTCALKSDGMVQCWGMNWYGQVDVPTGGGNVTAITSGAVHTCALKSDSTVECWGDTFTSNLVPPGLNHDIVEVTANAWTTCVLQSNGKVHCIGDHPGSYIGVQYMAGIGYYGDVCLLHTDESVTCLQNLPPSGLSNVVKLTTGGNHICALKSDGTVECWGGWSEDGQLNVPSGLVDVGYIAAGFDHSCAMKSDATVTCWGKNNYGQSNVPADLRPITVTNFVYEDTNISLGIDHTCILRSGSALCSANNDAIQDNVVQVSAGNMNTCNLRSDGTVECSRLEAPVGLSLVTAISSGDDHACALKSDSNVECWGDNTYGQIDVPFGLTGVVGISLGSYHSCALKSDKTVECWGDNRWSQSIVPSDLSGVMEISAGGDFTCTLGQTGFVRCWGSSYYGQTNVPSGLSDVVSVSAGSEHTCALKSDNTIICWGWDYYGQTNVPSGLTDIIEVSGGLAHTCALKSNNTITCWGRNNRSQVSFQNLLEIPQGVIGSNVASYDQKRIGVASDHKCAIRLDTTVECWGGDNEFGQNNVPSGLSGVVQILVINGETCAVKSDGQLICWGANHGYASRPNFPLDSVLQISGFNSVNQTTSLISRISTMCAVRTNGTVVCWGNNDYGQANVPSNLTDVKQVSVGGQHVCALKNNGTVQCWGSNGYSQTSVPSGLTGVIQISNSAGRTYALKSNGDIASWGFYSISNSNTNNIVQVNGGGCGLTSSGTSSCFIGAMDVIDFDNAPNYDSYESTIDSSCVLKSDNTVVCWNPVNGMSQSVPEDLRSQISSIVFTQKKLSSVSVPSAWWNPEGSDICNIKSDNTLMCGNWLHTKVGESMGNTGALDYFRFLPMPSIAEGTLLTPISRSLGEDIPRFCNLSIMHNDGYHFSTCGFNLWTNTTPAIAGTFKQVDVGYYHGCVLDTDDNLSCWRTKSYNDSGITDYGEATVPSGLGNVLQVAVNKNGYPSTCVIRSDSSVFCWGYGYGQNGTALSSDFTNVVQILNMEHVCALRSDGTVVCNVPVGYNAAGPSVPLGIGRVDSIAPTYHGVCTIQQPNSRLICWKYNPNNNYPSINANIPQISNVASVSGDRNGTCAVKTNGTVECWGDNLHGEANVPIGLTNVVEVSVAGGTQTCALKNTGEVECWGFDGIPDHTSTCLSGDCWDFRLNSN